MRKLTPAFVRQWSAAYPLGALEIRLLSREGPTIKRRGYVTRAELLEIARWKAGGRILSRIDKNNTNWIIRETTRAAFAAPQGLQHRILATLDFVNIRTATAILAVVNSKRDTVLDVRAGAAIKELVRLGDARPLSAYCDPKLPGYIEYLEECKRFAKAAHCDLRTLDRALWTWEKTGLP